jgi:hypothetical protein
VLIRDIIGGAEDDPVLAWAAEYGRVVLSHDVNTMGHAADQRVEDQPFHRGHLVEDLAELAYCSFPNEWENRIEYLPYPRP